MASVSVEEFLKGVLAAGTGQIAGRLAGEQQRMQREAEDFSRQAQLIQLQQQPEEESRRLIASQLPNLTPESQATFLAGVTNRPNPYAGLMQTPYARRLMGGMPQQVAAAPQGAPGGFAGRLTGQQMPAQAAPAVLNERSFNAPGIGRLEMTGIRKGEPEALQKQFEAASKAFTEADLSDDPRLQAEITAAMGAFPTQFRTPEDVAQAREVIGRLRTASQGLGPRLQGLREKQRSSIGEAYRNIEKDLQTASPAAAAAAILQGYDLEEQGKQYGGLNPTRRQFAPFKADIARIRELQASEDPADQAEANALAAKIQDQFLRRVDPQKEDQALQRLYKSMESLPFSQLADPKVRRQMFVSAGLQKYLVGPDGKPLPDDQIPMFGGAQADYQLTQLMKTISNPSFAKLTPEAQKPTLDRMVALSLLTGKQLQLPEAVNLRLTPEQMFRLGISRKQLDVTVKRYMLEKRRLEDQRNEAFGKLTDVDKARMDSAEEALAQARADVKEQGITPARVDLNREPRNAREQAAWDLVKRMIEAEKEYYNVQQTLALEPRPLNHEMWYRSKPKLPAPPPKPKGLIERGVEAVRGAVSGARPAQAAPKKAPGQMTDAELRAAYERAKRAPKR